MATLVAPSFVFAQQAYMSGQTIAPAYEGWERNDDGSFTLVFGYMNRNWEEVIDVPIGPENSIEPGGPDHGQPTHFYPRRNRFTFRIRVPADFGDKALVWTLTTNGETERAYGTLKRDYFIDDLVVQANYGAAGAAGGTPELPENEAPSLDIEGAGDRTALVGDAVTLAAVSTDDGKPRARSMRASNPRLPGRITTDSATGHRLAWFVYRGAGAVTFDPPQTKTWEDTRDGGNSPWSPAGVEDGGGARRRTVGHRGDLRRARRVRAACHRPRWRPRDHRRRHLHGHPLTRVLVRQPGPELWCSSWSNTSRTARSRTSGAYLLGRPMSSHPPKKWRLREPRGDSETVLDTPSGRL